MGGEILEYEAKDILRSGIKEGKRIGIEEGERIGIEKGKRQLYADLIKEGILTSAEVAKHLGMKEEELEGYLKTQEL